MNTAENLLGSKVKFALEDYRNKEKLCTKAKIAIGENSESNDRKYLLPI
jgi:hypothetical protein